MYDVWLACSVTPVTPWQLPLLNFYESNTFFWPLEDRAPGRTIDNDSHHGKCEFPFHSFAHTTLGARSFSVVSPKIWNSLPPALHSCNSHDTFRQHLKTHYFQQAFSFVATSLFAPQIRH